jgi:hypothetical protein
MRKKQKTTHRLISTISFRAKAHFSCHSLFFPDSIAYYKADACATSVEQKKACMVVNIALVALRTH